MNTPTDVDALVIDGTKLRQAREARNLSVAEVAALCTLSREQVQHIEDGGNRPFYTPAHKLLAIRKYALAMSIPYDDIVIGPGADDTMPVPDDAPPSLMVHGEGEEATDLRLAAVERNAEIRRKILIGVVTATILLAFYAKMRGTPDSAPVAVQPAVSAAATNDHADAPAAESAPVNKAAAAPATTAVASTPPSAAPTNAASASASTPAPVTSATDSTKATSAARPAEATTTTASASALPKAATTAVAEIKASTDTRLATTSESCAGKVGSDVKTWTPTYQRKADTRLFLVSQKETTVCVHDASGKAALLTLKARTGQAYSGKPPYVVQSPVLSEIEIYLQGMRARVPPQAPALRLQLSPASAAEAG